jgi:hypothetical protein
MIWFYVCKKKINLVGYFLFTSFFLSNWILSFSILYSSLSLSISLKRESEWN